MKKMLEISKLQFSPDQFYKVGMICFGVIALMGFFNLANGWYGLTIYSRISSMGSITLNIALVLFFNYLYHQVKPEKNMLSSEEISKVIENLK